MQKDFGITTIYVTHDQEEALTLSDRIAVFNKGYIEQIGTPNEVYNFSKTEFVCNFIGDINRLGDGVMDAMVKAGAAVDPKKHNYIRLERLYVNSGARPGQVALDGVIESREYYGLYIKYYIRTAGQILKFIERNDGVRLYEVGQPVSVVIDPKNIMAYEAKGEGAAP
jgi:iron(III) transport system ATP-binding protein